MQEKIISVSIQKTENGYSMFAMYELSDGVLKEYNSRTYIIDDEKLASLIASAIVSSDTKMKTEESKNV